MISRQSVWQHRKHIIGVAPVVDGTDLGCDPTEKGLNLSSLSLIVLIDRINLSSISVRMSLTLNKQKDCVRSRVQRFEGIESHV